MANEDVFDSFESTLRGRSAVNPWAPPMPDGSQSFSPDYDLVTALADIPLAGGSGSESGRLAKAIDAWVAYELRRAGFGDDEVWPRLTKPRVLPRDVAVFLAGLPAKEREAAHVRLLKNKRVAPVDARVLGRAYVKQVDVLIAQWSRGPELLVSTKSMVSSFRNNLANRFEEAYGDAKNLRGRFPLVSMGFLFFLRSTAAAEPGTLDKAVDMLRKLQQEADAYDACCLLVGEWADPPGYSGVAMRHDLVPPDLDAARFLATLIGRVLEHTPIDVHVEVREARSHRPLALREAEETAQYT